MQIPRRTVAVSWGEDTISAEVAGRPGGLTPVVLLHGAGGNRLTWWQQVAALATDRLVVVPDLRGAGRSTDHSDLAGPEQQVLDLEALRTALEIERWDVVGHSLGGWSALRAKALVPSTVRRCVVLSSIAGAFAPAAEEHWAAFTARLAAEGWPAESFIGVTESLTALWAASDPERAHLYQLIAGLNPPPSMTAPAMRIRDYDLPLAPLDDVHFVVGELDTIAPPAAVRSAADAVGGSFTLVSGTGHLPFFERPAVVNELLRALLG